MKCTRCDANVVTGALYCPNCGQHMNAGSPTPLLAASSAQRAANGVVTSPSQDTAPQRPLSAIVVRMTTGQQYRLRGQYDYLVGRAGEGHDAPDLDLSQWASSGVSREHAMIHIRRDGVFIEDMDSRNSTIHNGFRLMPLQWYPLKDKDEIRLGAIVLRVLFEYS